jgi:hypothetical protein
VEKSAVLSCPLCRARLVPGKEKRFETLNEHVGAPNKERDARPTLICSNPCCQTRVAGVFWAEDGEGPFHVSLEDKFAWIDGDSSPFGSYLRRTAATIKRVAGPPPTMITMALLGSIFEQSVREDRVRKVLRANGHELLTALMKTRLGTPLKLSPEMLQRALAHHLIERDPSGVIYLSEATEAVLDEVLADAAENADQEGAQTMIRLLQGKKVVRDGGVKEGVG